MNAVLALPLGIRIRPNVREVVFCHLGRARPSFLPTAVCRRVYPENGRVGTRIAVLAFPGHGRSIGAEPAGFLLAVRIREDH